MGRTQNEWSDNFGGRITQHGEHGRALLLTKMESLKILCQCFRCYK